MDHPRALRHAADGEAGAVRDGASSRCVSVVRIASAASAPPSAGERGGAASKPGEQLVQRQRRADHAGREHEHLLGRRARAARAACAGGRERVERALRAGRRVRDAGVDRRPPAARRARGAAARRRPARPARGSASTSPRRSPGVDDADEREVLAARAADPRVHARGDEALAAAVTLIPSTPVSRSPAVSSRPSARFAFCTAWPAAPLPRLSSAQMTIVVPVGAVGEDADLGRVGALHARELGRRRLRAARARPGSPRTRPRAARARRRRVCT